MSGTPVHGAGGSRPGRQRVARLAAGAALWCLAALALPLPDGLAPFVACLALATIAGWPRLREEAARIRGPLRAMTLLVCAVLAVVLASKLYFDLPWARLDSRSRLLLLPWAALLAYALRPPPRALWLGALFGLSAAFALAVLQAADGLQRARGWTNPIVFAEVVLMLMVLLACCRPRGRRTLLLVGLALGAVTIVLSGSRGVWPGLGLLLVAMALRAGWRNTAPRLLLLFGVLAAAAVTVVAIPMIGDKVRIAELHRDLSQYEEGDHNTSAGARMRLLGLAGRTYAAHPLAGVGVGNFGVVVRTLPECQGRRIMLCTLAHAHDDLAEWAATMGTAGLAAIVSLYALPLAWFWRLARAGPRAMPPRGPAWAGFLVVGSFVLCGLTQSIFAHQLTAGLYAALVGTLLGLALREAEDRSAGEAVG